MIYTAISLCIQNLDYQQMGTGRNSSVHSAGSSSISCRNPQDVGTMSIVIIILGFLVHHILKAYQPFPKVRVGKGSGIHDCQTDSSTNIMFLIHRATQQPVKLLLSNSVSLLLYSCLKRNVTGSFFPGVTFLLAGPSLKFVDFSVIGQNSIDLIFYV
jgi:hypothetical protein